MKHFRVIRNKKVYRRKLAVRRFVTMSLILGIFVFAGYTMYRNRMKHLEAAITQLAYDESRLSDVMLRQGYYLNEIVRLGDENYVAMLAREHLFSLPHETVFIIEDVDVIVESGEENYEN